MMARIVSYFKPGPFGTQTARTATAYDYENSAGNKAVIVEQDGKFRVDSWGYSADGFGSKQAAAHALIDHSPIGRSDWEEVA